MTSAQLEQAVKDYFHAQAALLTALDSAATGRQPNPRILPLRAAQPGLPLSCSPVGPDDSAITTQTIPEADARALYAEEFKSEFQNAATWDYSS